MRPVTVVLPSARQQLYPRLDPSHHIRVQTVETLEAFDALRTDWNNLVDGDAAFSPFQSWKWNRIWWKHLAGNDKLQMLIFRANREVIGIAPFYRRRSGLRGIGPTTLIPIGSHHYRFGLTEQWELLFPSNVRRELFAALWRELAQRRWSLTVLPGLAESDQLPSALEARAVLPEHHVVLHTLGLPSTWDEFVGGLSKNLRKNIRRYPQRLIDDNFQFSFSVAQTPEEVGDALPTFFDLHRARATAAADEFAFRHTDRFRSPERRAFLREVATSFSAAGQFKVGLLKIGQRFIAAETWFEKGDRMYLYHSGVAPNWAEYSVGFVTNLETLKYGINRGFRRVELLRGEGHYKERWRPSAHTQETLVLARHPRLVRMMLGLRRRRSR